MRLRDFFPDSDWWFGIPAGREGNWWRAHVPAHVGQGVVFFLAWGAIGVDAPWLAALFFSVLWEAWQRETWPAMRLVNNVWDVILGSVGIGLAWLLLRGV